MSVTRRSALEFASQFAVAGSIATPALATRATKILARPLLVAPSVNQRFSVIAAHDGARPHLATIVVHSPETTWLSFGRLDASMLADILQRSKSRGFRLRRLTGYETAKGVRFAAISQYANGSDWTMRHGLTRDEFDAATRDLARDGYRPAFLDGHGTKAGPRFAAIWEQGAGEREVFASLTAPEFRAKSGALAARGLKPVRLASYLEGGAPKYAAIFERRSGQVRAHLAMNEARFRQIEVAAESSGLRQIDAGGHCRGGRPSFCGIWEKA